MKKIVNVVVKIESSLIVKGSTRGCRLRYTMWVKTALGESMRISTNPASKSNYSCSMEQRSGRFLRITARSIDGYSWIADEWDSSASCGVDLEAEFVRQQAHATNKE